MPSQPDSPPASQQEDQVPSQGLTQVPPQPSSHPVTQLESPTDNLPSLSLGSLLASPVGSTSSPDQPSHSSTPDPNPLRKHVFTNLFKLPATIEPGIHLWSWEQLHQLTTLKNCSYGKPVISNVLSLHVNFLPS